MNALKKTFLFPIVITAIIVVNTCLCWLLTAFFAKIFSVEIGVAAVSPMVFIYIVAFVGSLYMIVYACQYIDEEL
jgi:uncharacterized protein with PQ loop repeat